MEITFLNYKLVKIQSKDIELLRNWRNNEVQHFMIYKEYITEEMQQKWFESIDNYNNFFFIIYKDDKAIGLIDIKNIDWKLLTADTGIYIAIQKYRESEAPIASVVMSAVFMKNILQINTVYGKSLSNNKSAIAYNLSIGFKIVEKSKDVVIMSIDVQNTGYDNALNLIDKLRRININEHSKDMCLIISKEEFEKDTTTQWLIENKIKPQFPNFNLNETLILL